MQHDTKSAGDASSVSDGLEPDEEQSKSRLDIAGWPFNTGQGIPVETESEQTYSEVYKAAYAATSRILQLPL